MSRRLDAAVAETVMGWTRHAKAMHPTDNRTIDSVLYCPPDFPGDRSALNVVPAYSADMEAAMQIVSKLFKAGYVVSLHANGVDGFYWCNICTPKPESKHYESPDCASAAEAVCYAALSAVQGKEQG